MVFSEMAALRIQEITRVLVQHLIEYATNFNTPGRLCSSVRPSQEQHASYADVV